MRRIYLIRHGKPDMPPGQKLCIGITDLPLGKQGHRQGKALAEIFKEKNCTAVYCSDLQRAIQTARYLTDSPRILPQLGEMQAGEWEGLPFSHIKARWPEIYEARGRDITIPIPGAEPWEAVQARFLAGLQIALEETDGDIALVAHATGIQTAICHLLGLHPNQCRRFPLDYGSVTTLEEETGHLTLIAMGELPYQKEGIL